jgi:olefin beta-lactone synthetase
VYDLFEKAAREHPDRVAIISGDGCAHFGELAAAVEQTAAQFRAAGIGRGDRVLVFVPMGIDLYRVVLALFKMGATAVFLDEWAAWKRVELCCRLADCKGFIGVWKARALAWFSGPLRRIPVKLSLRGYRQYTAGAATCAASPDDAALITFTTGSTGTPKAALRSHGFLREQFDVLREEIRPRAGDVNMTTLPIVLLINLGVGAVSVIPDFKASKPHQLQPARILRQLETHRVQCVIASPFFVRQLAAYCLDNKTPVKSLKKIFTGGAPVFPGEARLLRAAFPETEVRIAYGSTEAEPISVIDGASVAALAPEAPMPGLPAGIPNTRIRLKIIRIHDGPLNQTETCVPGEIGEIVATGPHVLKTYFNNPEAMRRNKIIEPDGTLWHRTGDSGYLDAHGRLFLTGRCAALFYFDGRLISPFVYENLLQNQPGVRLGTVVPQGGSLVFVLEMSDRRFQKAVQNTIDALGFSRTNVVFLREMPRDARHFSKIDYEKLLFARFLLLLFLYLHHLLHDLSQFLCGNPLHQNLVFPV